jgi:hypothetical protein
MTQKTCFNPFFTLQTFHNNTTSYPSTTMELERLAAQLEQIKTELLACQDPGDRQRLQIQYRQIEAEIRTEMEAVRLRIQQTQRENDNMRTALEKLQQREQ